MYIRVKFGDCNDDSYGVRYKGGFVAGLAQEYD